MKTATTAVSFLCVIGLLTRPAGQQQPFDADHSRPASVGSVYRDARRRASFYRLPSQLGNVSITLASLVPKAPGPALSKVMGLGVGTPNGTECAVTNSVTTAPGLTAQLVNSLTAATYCTKIYDLGELTGPVDFAVRIVHP